MRSTGEKIVGQGELRKIRVVMAMQRKKKENGWRTTSRGGGGTSRTLALQGRKEKNRNMSFYGIPRRHCFALHGSRLTAHGYEAAHSQYMSRRRDQLLQSMYLCGASFAAPRAHKHVHWRQAGHRRIPSGSGGSPPPPSVVVVGVYLLFFFLLGAAFAFLLWHFVAWRLAGYLHF